MSKIQVTFGQLLTLDQTLTVALQRPMPVMASIRFGEFTKSILPYMQTAAESHLAVAVRHGKKSGEMVNLAEHPDLQRELMALANETVTVNASRGAGNDYSGGGDGADAVLREGNRAAVRN